MSAAEHRLTIASCLVAANLLTAIAQADPVANSERAQSLFDDAVKRLEQKDFAAACPELAESFALDPAGGTALDLAFCYESEGRLASALESYRAALAVAEADHREGRKLTAEKKIGDLETRVAHLRLVASAEEWHAQGWQVLLDAKLIAPEAAAALLVVDSGAHVVTVSAPGKRIYARSFAISDGQTSEIVIEPLADAALARSVIALPKSVGKPAPTFVMRDDVARRHWSFAVGGTGIAAIGVGIVSGVIAASLHATSSGLCPSTGCSLEGADAEKQADRAAWVSDIGFVAGAALIGTGAYLFFSSRNAKRVSMISDAMLGKVVFDLR